MSGQEQLSVRSRLSPTQTTMSDVAMEDQVSLLSTRSVRPIPDTLTKLIKRIRALTIKLLPLEVEMDVITDPTSRVITPAVISAYIEGAGDFGEALPYCLLRARQTFVWDANHDAANYGENMSRAMACETLARRVLHTVPPDRLDDIMSCRFRHSEWDGDESALSSALELAIDQQATVFLSCSEAQAVVNSLWRGDWVQVNREDNEIDYEEYKFKHDGTLWAHIDPSRLSVPRYQNAFRITLWLVFLFIYSRAIQQPIEQNRQPRHQLDEWEILLYVQALAYSVEEFHKLYKMLRFFTWRVFNFWRVISLLAYSLLIAAFILRVWGLFAPDDDQSSALKLKSFQVLSCVSPLIWMKLVTVVEGFKYVGTMQICVSRMLQESTLFFVLLSILGIGFAQGMYALDAADGVTDHGVTVINTLLQALLQAPDFEQPAVSNYGLILYYMWNVATTVILLNVLISLFSSAYDDITDDAEAHFLAFFAEKTIAMIRELITVVEGFKYVGTMQICVSRMLQESTIFFVLLSILGIGFAQGMYALDAADGVTDHGVTVINTLLQALLQAPDFEQPSVNNFGLVLYYMWNVATTVILLNVLISLFSSAYDDITDDAEAHFLAFFAEKTIVMIRAPDSYVYPAPFNLVEVFLVAPFELILSHKSYAKLNRTVMFVMFFIPLTMIALFEAHLDTRRNVFMRHMFSATQDGEDEDPDSRDPQVNDANGLLISKKSFDELVKVFPNSFLSSEATIMQELHQLRHRMEELFKQLEAKNVAKAST
ncbi:unnamed protein product [Rhizoctonia solani]|uniref:Calcium channel YVC1 n=1 Tax=Rhizoctonia solani TaxID=456999 RepID=A0A8H3DLI0_9AGAM|nr:unnamed protein product [Rhizoctonia solani]